MPPEVEKPTFSNDAFISYSRKDREFAARLKKTNERVRADQDIGALIVNEMLERLYFSDLVPTDMTLPNSNVYYEVGIRHAAKGKGCVLIGAD